MDAARVFALGTHSLAGISSQHTANRHRYFGPPHTTGSLRPMSPISKYAVK
jgi:hypothetical protein